MEISFGSASLSTSTYLEMTCGSPHQSHSSQRDGVFKFRGRFTNRSSHRKLIVLQTSDVGKSHRTVTECRPICSVCSPLAFHLMSCSHTSATIADEMPMAASNSDETIRLNYFKFKIEYFFRVSLMHHTTQPKALYFHQLTPVLLRLFSLPTKPIICNYIEFNEISVAAIIKPQLI